MADIVIIILGFLLLISGIVFCVVPLIPGPMLSYAAMFTLYFLHGTKEPSLALMIVTGLFSGIVITLDMIMPGVGAKKFDCSKSGVWGSVIGSIAGAFFIPWGLIIGPFAGAFIGELLAGKRVVPSARGAIGAFIGYATGIALKIEWCLVLVVCYVFALISMR